MKNTVFTKLLAAGVASLFGCVLLTACSGVEFAVSVPCDHKAVLLERVEATSTANGKTAGSMCELCGQILDAPELIPAPGHNFKEVSCTEPLTCILCGATEGLAVGHAFEEATCKKPMTCRKCGATEGEVLAHDYKDGVCAVCGERKESEGLSFTLSEDGESYTVTGMGSCKDSILVIPDTHDGKPVTRIGASAFAGANITEAFLMKGVLALETRSFEECHQLERVTLPEGLESIGACVFYNCTALRSVNIPQGVKSIGGWVLNGCAALERVEIPDSVESFGKSVFSGCVAMTSVKLSAQTTVLGDYMFMNCASLKEISLSGAVTELGPYAFYGCAGLETVRYEKTKADWQSVTKGKSWNTASGAFVVVCSDGEINK